MLTLTQKFQFPSNGKVYSETVDVHDIRITDTRFQFPSNGKVYSEDRGKDNVPMRPISFNSLQTGKCIQRDPILSPVGPRLRTPKTKRELREAFFTSKFTPKTPQTHVCIDPNAIF